VQLSFIHGKEKRAAVQSTALKPSAANRGAATLGADASQSAAPTYAANAAAPYAHPYYWAPFILMGNWL